MEREIELFFWEGVLAAKSCRERTKYFGKRTAYHGWIQNTAADFHRFSLYFLSILIFRRWHQLDNVRLNLLKPPTIKKGCWEKKTFICTCRQRLRPSLETSPPEPSPAEPSPAEPSPTEPSPAEPSPAEPSPAEPSPVEPSPVELSESSPAEQIPSEQNSAEPSTAEPSPPEPSTEPSPVEASPVEASSVEASSVEASPVGKEQVWESWGTMKTCIYTGKAAKDTRDCQQDINGITINAEIVFSPFNLGKQVCVMAMGRQRRERGDGSATVMILHSGDSGIVSPTERETMWMI